MVMVAVPPDILTGTLAPLLLAIAVTESASSEQFASGVAVTVTVVPYPAVDPAVVRLVPSEFVTATLPLLTLPVETVTPYCLVDSVNLA